MESRIITGDFLAVAGRELGGRRFELVIADPPYNVGKDFGNDSDRRPLAEYLDWSRRWIALALDLLAPGGLLYIYGQPEILARIAADQPLDQQRHLVWAYKNKVVPGLSFWQRSHEGVLALWRGARPRLRVDQIREAYSEAAMAKHGKLRKATPNRFTQGRPGRVTEYRMHHAGALPRDVLHQPALAGTTGTAERVFLCRDCGSRAFSSDQRAAHAAHRTIMHPTQKPLALSARLIRSVIGPDGGNVLIPFGGSGSECVAAQDLGATFTAFELNPDYADLARAWVAAATPPPRLL